MKIAKKIGLTFFIIAFAPFASTYALFEGIYINLKHIWGRNTRCTGEYSGDDKHPGEGC